METPDPEKKADKRSKRHRQHRNHITNHDRIASNREFAIFAQFVHAAYRAKYQKIS